MAFLYRTAPLAGRLVQGEILGKVWEHVPLEPPVEVVAGQTVPVRSVFRERVVVLTQDCDLLQDFRVRFDDDGNEVDGADDDPRTVPHVLLCIGAPFDVLKGRLPGSDVKRRVKNNQDERYHTLAEAGVGADPQPDAVEEEGRQGGEEVGPDEGVRVLPQLTFDFRHTLSLPTGLLYTAVLSGQVDRVALIPSPYILDLNQRFHGYHARIPIEE